MRVREIDDDEGPRLLRIIRRGAGSVVTWRRPQIVLLSAQAMPVAIIAEVSFTSADRVRDVIHNFNADGSTRCIRNTKAVGRRPSRCPSAARSRRSPSRSQPSTTWSRVVGEDQEDGSSKLRAGRESAGQGRDAVPGAGGAARSGCSGWSA